MPVAGKRSNGFVVRAATAPLAAAGLIAGFGVAEATDSRTLGGLVLAAFGLTCISIWLRRDGRRTAIVLTCCGLAAFAISHLLGLMIGAWPAVTLVAAGMAWLCWRMSDSAAAAAASNELAQIRRGSE